MRRALGRRRDIMSRKVPKMGVGDIAMVEYEGEKGLFHCRGLLRHTTRAVVRHVMGFEPQGGEGSAWWVLTPTGDVYPECIALHQDITGLCLLDQESDGIARGSMRPNGRRLQEVFGFEAYRSIGDWNVQLFARSQAAAEAADLKARQELGLPVPGAQAPKKRLDGKLPPAAALRSPEEGFEWRCIGPRTA